MSQAVIERAPESVEQKTPPPTIMHRVCQCQMNRLNVQGLPGVARCGAKVAGHTRSVGSLTPIEVCVICADLFEARTPCQLCGVAP